MGVVYYLLKRSHLTLPLSQSVLLYLCIFYLTSVSGAQIPGPPEAPNVKQDYKNYFDLFNSLQAKKLHDEYNELGYTKSPVEDPVPYQTYLDALNSPEIKKLRDELEESNKKLSNVYGNGGSSSGNGGGWAEDEKRQQWKWKTNENSWNEWNSNVNRRDSNPNTNADGWSRNPNTGFHEPDNDNYAMVRRTGRFGSNPFGPMIAVLAIITIVMILIAIVLKFWRTRSTGHVYQQDPFVPQPITIGPYYDGQRFIQHQPPPPYCQYPKQSGFFVPPTVITPNLPSVGLHQTPSAPQNI